ncbi:hypothetical protein BH10CYA1_BH10CYA1_18500 [soil metagenome]
MYSKYQPMVLKKSESHVFRMLGATADVISTCKATMSAAGFSEFTSYGHSFACYRQLEASQSRLMIYVNCAALSQDLCEISFQKVETGMPSVHSQMIHRRLDKIQSILETKVA